MLIYNRSRPALSLLAALVFIVPVQPLLQVNKTIAGMKTYRLIEAVILIMTAVTLVKNWRSRPIPSLLTFAFWIGAGGLILATVFSAYPLQSIDTGILEFLIPYCVLYLFLINVQDRKTALLMIGLFVFGALLESAVQAWLIVKANSDFAAVYHPGEAISLAPTAENFLFHKASLPTTLPGGVPYSYGNVDNYASLWVLLVPLVAGLSFIKRVQAAASIALAGLLYLGLFTYSRGAVIVVAVSLAALLMLRFRTPRLAKVPALVALALLAAIHINTASFSYFSSGLAGFSKEMSQPSTPPRPPETSPSAAADAPKKLDNSGNERADAFLTGITLAKANWLTGIGFGAYPIIETKFTAPHNIALLRLDESGVLGLLSFLVLALYSPFRIAKMLWSGTADSFNIAIYVAVSAFMLKAFFFGASFSVSSNIVWGFAVMMLLAFGLIPKETSLHA